MLCFDLVVNMLVYLRSLEFTPHRTYAFVFKVDLAGFVRLLLVVLCEHRLQSTPLERTTFERNSPVLGAMGVSMFPRLRLLFTVCSVHRPLATSIAMPTIFLIWWSMKLCPSKQMRR